jgi:genome maintenance exonuclease 1
VFNHVGIDLGYADLESHTGETKRTYATPSGVKYPSITTVLSILSEDSIKAWRKRVGEETANKISTRASLRGTKVHEAIEKFVNNQEWSQIVSEYTPDIIESLINVKEILSERIGNVYGQELPLYSDHLRVAGRVDCVAEFDGKNSIIDFKTSKKPKRRDWITNYFCQEAAYALMWEERTGMPITQLVTVVAVDGSEPQVFIEKRDDFVPLLRETIERYEKRVVNQ